MRKDMLLKHEMPLREIDKISGSGSLRSSPGQMKGPYYIWCRLVKLSGFVMNILVKKTERMWEEENYLH